MPLIPLICPNCGGNLTVDSDKDAAICEFCGKPYIVKEAIVKNYINNVTNINAENVNIYSQKDFVIKGGVLMEYNGENVDVIIPDTVKKISTHAFKGTAIESVTMPDSVTGFVSYEHGNSCPPEYAFKDCDRLVHVKFSRNIEELGFLTFFGCSSLKEVEIPIRVKKLDRTFYNCSSLQRIVLPEGLKTIGDLAFSGCSSLQEIKIPSGVTAIGNGAFSGCSSLQEIKIPSGVTAIGDLAFSGCSSLQEIKIPSGVTAIGRSAFEGCSSLHEIEIPSDVTAINEKAFKGCSSLREINIPSSVHSIGDYVFRECESLSIITGTERFELHDFCGSKYYEIESEKRTKEERRSRGKCQHCGGDFSGLFKKVCTKCGKEKDY